MNTFAARIVYVALAWLFVAAVLAQVSLAGLALFNGAGWTIHRDMGHSIVLLPMVLLILAWVGRMPRPALKLAALLFGLVVVQVEVFAAIRHQMPALAALHPVLALLVFSIGFTVAQNAWRIVSTSRPQGGATEHRLTARTSPGQSSPTS